MKENTIFNALFRMEFIKLRYQVFPSSKERQSVMSHFVRDLNNAFFYTVARCNFMWKQQNVWRFVKKTHSRFFRLIARIFLLTKTQLVQNCLCCFWIDFLQKLKTSLKGGQDGKKEIDRALFRERRTKWFSWVWSLWSNVRVVFYASIRHPRRRYCTKVKSKEEGFAGVNAMTGTIEVILASRHEHVSSLGFTGQQWSTVELSVSRRIAINYLAYWTFHWIFIHLLSLRAFYSSF